MFDINNYNFFHFTRPKNCQVKNGICICKKLKLDDSA